MRSERKRSFTILLVLAGLLMGIADPFAVHSGNVTPTNTWVDFYSTASSYLEVPVPVGAAIAVFDPQGVQCGAATVTFVGKYGIMPCYGDDPLTPQDEGAVLGDALHFTINGQAAQTEAISVNGAPVPPNTVVVWSPAQSLWQVNLRTVAEGTPTQTPTSAVTQTATPTQILTVTPSATSSPTPTTTASSTASPTETVTATPSHTPTSSATVTVTPTRTPTLTMTATVTRTTTQTPRQVWLPLVLR